jgi:outer membrane lipoprotein SlyB
MYRLVLAIALTLPLAGCAARGPYHAAVVVEHDASSVVQALQQAEITEFNAGRISASEHQTLEAGIQKVALAGVALNNALSAGVPTSITGALNAFVQTVTDLNTSGVLSIKNQQSQQILTTSINTLKAIIANLQANLPTGVTQ